MKKTLNYKKLTIHTLFIVAIILLAAISLQAGFAANTYNIDNSTTGGIKDTLAINATHGDTILLDEGTYTGSNNTGIAINKNITIQGKTKGKVILDAQGLSRIFTINNNLNVTFINITFTNGYVFNQNGGAINNNNAGTKMTFINCGFINNTAGWNGGGIYNLGSLTLINSSFTGNNASNGNNGGGVYTNGFSIIIDSTFLNNFASMSSGALGIGSASANSRIINSTFIDNVASNNGGVTYNNAANVTIINSTFIGNRAGNNYGGAIENRGANLTIIGSNFINNRGAKYGGAIWNNAYNITVSNCNFTNNNALDGGAIYNNGGINVIILNNAFTNNIASNKGGSIYNSGNMSVFGNIMSGNSAGLGWMIYNAGSMGVLNLTFIGNLTYVVVNGSKVTIYATLTDDMGNTVTGQNINVYVNGILGGVLVKNIESIEGNVSFDIIVYGEDGDLFPVNGTYDGIGSYSIVINEGLLSIKLAADPTPYNITKIPTNSTISAKDTTVGKSTTIKGIAKDKTGKVLANTKLTVTVDGKTYTVTTNNAGEWSLKYTPTREGSYKVSVTFAGNSTHEGFTNSATFKATKTTKKTNKKIPTKITLKRNGNKITATLTDENGNSLAGKKITFRVKGIVIGVGITNAEGKATIYYKDALQKPISAKFTGDDQYDPSSASLDPVNAKTGNLEVYGKVAMKKTGMPIIAVLIVLLTSLGLIGYRKRN